MYVLCAYLCPGAPGDPGIDGPDHSEGNRGPSGAPGDGGVRGPPGNFCFNAIYTFLFQRNSHP